MKKSLLLVGAVAIVLATVPMFAAFEAHVINVTAHIENALGVSPEPLQFGTVFPQEYIIKPITVSLSESFLEQSRVTQVNYVINQKLKPCPVENNEPIDETCVLDTAEATPENPTGYHYLSLCSFLSKGPDSDVRNDQGERSYFQGDHCIEPTPQDGAIGLLIKDTDQVDTWNIDLKVPPVAGTVGQDWPEGCPTVPTNSATYGCDLWVEVTGIGSPS